MKSVLFFTAFLFTNLIYAQDAYYCKLENTPAVKKALQQALTDVEAIKNGVALSPEAPQFIAVNGMGDAFEFWGTSILVYGLNGLANGNRLSVAVKVSYTSFFQKEAFNEGSTEAATCVDTGEVNPEILYIDTQDGIQPLVARPYVL